MEYQKKKQNERMKGSKETRKHRKERKKGGREREGAADSSHGFSADCFSAKPDLIISPEVSGA